MLSEHKSQREWLDRSQGMDSYVNSMLSLCSRIGQLSGEFMIAEGWPRHLHLGISGEHFDPLSSALGSLAVNKESI